MVLLRGVDRAGRLGRGLRERPATVDRFLLGIPASKAGEVAFASEKTAKKDRTVRRFISIWD